MSGEEQAPYDPGPPAAERLEPGSQGVYFFSAAVSLKRIADVLEEILYEVRTIRERS